VSKEVIALTLTVVVHIVGMATLVWALLLDDEDRPDWRDWWPGWGGEDDDRPSGDPPGPRGGDRLPLPDAAQSSVRLREPGRLAEAHPRPGRRPEHPPERVPQRPREPAR